MRLRRRGLAVLALVATSCRTPTQITVEVQTDVCTDLVGVNATVGPVGQVEGRPPTSSSPPCDPSTGRVGSIVVTPSAGRDDEVEIRIAGGVKRSPDGCRAGDLTDCIVARRALHYIPHESLVVRVDLRSACRSVECPVDTTCVNGTCVSSKIDAEACKGSGCDEKALGGGDAGPKPTVVPPGWSDFPSKAPIAGRVGHTTVWTGSEVIVFGGTNGTTAFSDGAAYDPAKGTWRAIADASTVGLAARRGHVAVWTGTEMFAGAGGDAAGKTAFADFARYDPKTDRWTTVASMPVALDLAGAVVLPSGKVLVAFGRTGTGAISASGFVFDFVAGSWSGTGVAIPRTDAVLFLIGGKAHALGGFSGAIYSRQVPKYDPSSNTWDAGGGGGVDCELAPGASGDGFAFTYGGIGHQFPSMDRTAIASAASWFDPAAGDWASLPAVPASAMASPARSGAAVFVGAGSLWVWGGATTIPLDTGATFSTSAKTWSAMPAGGPSARKQATATWVGDHAIFFGGRDASTFYAEGKRFKP